MVFYFPVGDRLSNVHVGITDTSPNDVTPSLDNYDVCATYLDSVGAAATVTLFCAEGTAGRYLIVQLEKQEQLSLCEVEVFIGEKIRALEKGKNVIT